MKTHLDLAPPVIYKGPNNTLMTVTGAILVVCIILVVISTLIARKKAKK